MTSFTPDVTGSTVQAGLRATPPKPVGRSLWPYSISIILCILVLNSVYKLPKIDYRIPLKDYGDATFYNAVVKNFVEAGHYYVNPLLGAPGQQEMYDFPLPHAVHVLGWAVLKLFTRDYGIVINLYYLLTFVLQTIAAVYVFRKFGVPAALAVAGGLLFAFLPFHLMRAQGHLMLTSYYLVPLVVMVTLWISGGKRLFGFEYPGGATSGQRFIARAGVGSLLVCLLIGSDNPYWALFSGMFFATGALIARFYYGRRKALWTATILTGVVFTAFVANLAPNLIYAHKHGLNPVNHRSPGEAEVYGLKIVQMLLPVRAHRVPALAQLEAGYEAQAPLVNENATATLGMVGALGFLVLLGCFFVRECDPDTRTLSVLNLVAVLVGTVGGFGSLFAFIAWSQFRGYNRISVFISFFCLFAILKLVDSLIRSKIKPSLQWGVTITAALILGGLGLADEIPRHIADKRSLVEATYRQDQAFIDRIETMVPPHSMIFQFPYIPFLGPVPANTAMVQYDELKGYLHSDSLRWSGGAIIDRPTDLGIRDVSARPVDQMVAAVAKAGFTGIYLDRYGYQDRGAEIDSKLQSYLGVDPITSQDGRRAFYLLDPLHLKTLQAKSESGQATDLKQGSITASTRDGCWPLEGTPERNWHWCTHVGEIIVSNPTDKTRTVVVEALFGTGYSQTSALLINGPSFNRKLQVDKSGKSFRASFPANPGDSVLWLRSDAKVVVANGDPRTLVFFVRNLHIK